MMLKQTMLHSEEGPAPARKAFVARREPVRTVGREQVRTSFFDARRKLPLMVEPVSSGIELAAWAAENRQWIEDELVACGGIVFRGFDVSGQESFERFVTGIASKTLHYREGATPRTHLGHKVYTSTEYPPSYPIMLHNELSYVLNWPTRIWFCCLTPAAEGGETTVCDVRRVFHRIPAPVREKFGNKGWMLVRNYGDCMGLPWRAAFGVNDRRELEDYCRQADLAYEWRGGDRLRTRQVRPAMARHPRTKEWLWFNHIAFWHLSALPAGIRDSMLAVFDEQNLPYQTCYGDGSPIEESDIAAIVQAYDDETVPFAWQRGDVMMLDNMLVAHGRATFAGARKVIVSMGDPTNDRGL